jgi:hypothetical protein
MRNTNEIHVLACAAMLAMMSSAQATVRESVTLTDASHYGGDIVVQNPSGGPVATAVASNITTPDLTVTDPNQTAGAVTNLVTIQHTFTGGYRPKAIHFDAATLHLNSGASTPAQLHILVIPPGTNAEWFILQPSRASTLTTDQNYSGYAYNIPYPVSDAAGTWTFKFFLMTPSTQTAVVERFVAPFTISLDDANAFPTTVVSVAPSGGVYAEQEPNDDPLLGANLIAGFSNGNSITGITTSSTITSVPPGTGATTTSDQFFVQMAAQPTTGIYRNQLVVTNASGTSSNPTVLIAADGAFAIKDSGGTQHRWATIVGTTTSGTFSTSTNFVSASTATSNSKYITWYGFGKQEVVPMMFATGTLAYTATVTTTAISPTPITTTFSSGLISFGSTPVTIFDASYNTVPGGRGVTSATLAPGTYFVAAGLGSTTMLTSYVDLASYPTTPPFTAITPDWIMNTSTGSGVPTSLTVTDSLGISGTTTWTGGALTTRDFSWFTLTVAVPAALNATGQAVNGTDHGPVLAPGYPALITIHAFPTAPNAVGPGMVTVDASAVGLGTLTLYDDGTNGDATAGDNIFSVLVTIPSNVSLGVKVINFTVNDSASNVATGSFAMSLVQTATNDHCSNPTPIMVGIPVNFDTTNADTDGPNIQLCTGFPELNLTQSTNNDVWFLFVAPYTGPFKFKVIAFSGTNSQNWVMSMYQGSDCSATTGRTWEPSPGHNAFDIDANCHTGQYGAVNGQGTGSLIAPNLVAGQSYLLRLGSTQTGSGAKMTGQVQAYGMILSPAVPHPTLGFEFYLVDNMNWHFAELAAQNLGGHLPSLHSADDTAFLINSVWTPYSTQGGNTWCGLNASLDTNHATWNWTDGTPVDYDHFASDPANGLNFYTAFFASGDWTSTNFDTNPNTTLPTELGIIQIPASGVCCNAGACTFIFRSQNSNCTDAGGSVGVGTACTPNPCPPPGVCCRGATCNASVSQANCVGSGTAGALFTSAGSACNAGGSTTTPCCYADFNKNGTLQVQDIFDYLNAWFQGSLYAKVGGDGVSGTLAVADIFAFLNAWFAGC